MPLWRLPLLLLVAAAGASLAGCSSGGGSTLAAMGRDAPNSADVTFLRSMTEHEQETLGVTRLAQRRALRAELRGLTRKMTSEQEANLRKLGSLESRIVRRPRTTRTASSAMLDVTRLKAAPSFDYELMRTMIEQNQRAIAIARREMRFGRDPEAKRLAAEIASTREKELERFRGWLHLWYGGSIQPSPPSIAPPGGGGDKDPGPGPRSPDKRPPVPL